MVGLAAGIDTAQVNDYLSMNQIKSLFPRDMIFRWSQNPYKYDPTKSLYELHAIKITTRDGRAPLQGDVITGARPSSGVTGSEVKVDFSMNAEGAKTWARMTRENVDRCIALVLDGYVRSYPRVVGEITGGNTEVTGDFTIDEANDLANILKSGKMPAPAHIVSDTIIGPTLGKEAISAGLVSFVISFIIVLVIHDLLLQPECRNNCRYRTGGKHIPHDGNFSIIGINSYSPGYCRYCSYNGYVSRCKRPYL